MSEAFKSAADLAKEIGHATEVPISIRDSFMAQVLGQKRNHPIECLMLVRPGNQPPSGKGMTQIMKPWSGPPGIGLSQRTQDQSTEHSLNCRTVEGLTTFVNKEVVSSDVLIAGTGIVVPRHYSVLADAVGLPAGLKCSILVVQGGVRLVH